MKINKKSVSMFLLFAVGVTSLGVATFLVLKPADVNSTGLSKKESSDLQSPYVGQEYRDIKSLSDKDIEALESGSGTAFSGLAKPAELSGYPGPKHVLEMKDELILSSSKREEIEELFERMNEEAKRLGAQIITIESKISEEFAGKTADLKSLEANLTKSASLYGQLRLTHLGAHLEMMDILSEKQVHEYITLRGYDLDDPCQNVPDGHDPEQWRLHNDCD